MFVVTDKHSGISELRLIPLEIQELRVPGKLECHGSLIRYSTRLSKETRDQ